MKSIVLSVVVIGALMVAGIGGTLADFSDYEVSEGNYFETGSLDLAVSDFAGNHYNGVTMPAIYTQSDAWPCCDKSRFFDLENFGQGAQYDPMVYIHFKNLDCYWVQPKDGSVVWVDDACNVVAEPANPGAGEPQGTYADYPKPLTEPEFVAECGGVAGEDRNGDPVTVPGLGICYGETCELPEHIGVKMWITKAYPEDEKPETSDDVPDGDWKAVDLSAYDTDPKDGVVKLNELECVQFKLATLPCNKGMWVHVALHLQDIDEDDLIAAGVLTDPGTGYGWFDETNPIEKKFDHWPTNAIQKDGVKFDIAFELLQVGP